MSSPRKRFRTGGSGGGGQTEPWGGGGGGTTSSRAMTLGNAELDAARQPSTVSTTPAEIYRFYHGTSWDAAEKILREGFQPSAEGCLGPGIYVARREKAERFARDEDKRHGEAVGGLVEVLVTVRNPKFVEVNEGWNDASWQATGHDACRAESTTASTNMEWCIKDKSQVQVIRTIPVRCATVDADKEEWVLERHAAVLEAEIREREQKVATLREWVGSIKRKRDEERAEKERAEKERLTAEAREHERRRQEQERFKREEAEIRRVQRLWDRGRYFCINVSDSEAQSQFMARCETPEKFQTVKHCAVFDSGGFFISRDNGRSYWSGLPSELCSRLIAEGKNTQGVLQYAVGSVTGAYYAELNDGNIWWNTTGLRNDESFDSAVRDGRSRRVEFGEGGVWIVLFENGGSSWSSGLPTKLYNKLNSRNPRLPKASEVTLGPNDTWFVRWADGKTEWSLPKRISDSCNSVCEAGGKVTHISFPSESNYLIRATARVPTPRAPSPRQPTVHDSRQDDDYDYASDDSQKQEHYRAGAKVYWREEYDDEWKQGVICYVHYDETYDVGEDEDFASEYSVESTRLYPRFEADDTVQYRHHQYDANFSARVTYVNSEELPRTTYDIVEDDGERHDYVKVCRLSAA